MWGRGCVGKGATAGCSAWCLWHYEGLGSSWGFLSFISSGVAVLLCHGQEGCAVSVSVNHPGSRLLPLTLCLELCGASEMKCCTEHEVPLLLAELVWQCLTCPPETAIASGSAVLSASQGHEPWQLHSTYSASEEALYHLGTPGHGFWQEDAAVWEQA